MNKLQEVNNLAASNVEFQRMLAHAGAKAFIYHGAGYVMSASPPLSRVELATQQLKAIEDHNAKDALLAVGHLSECDGGEISLNGIQEFIPIGTMKRVCATLPFTTRVLTRTAKRLGEEVRREKAMYETRAVNQYTAKTWLGAYPELHDILKESHE